MSPQRQFAKLVVAVPKKVTIIFTNQWSVDIFVNDAARRAQRAGSAAPGGGRAGSAAPGGGRAGSAAPGGGRAGSAAPGGGRAGWRAGR